MKNQAIILKNGMKVAIVQMDGFATVSAFLVFGTGSCHETKKDRGLTHFIEHMLFKGTIRRPALTQLCHEIDRLGGEIEAFTTKELTCFSVKIVKKYWELGLDVLADMIQNPLFPILEIEKERNVIIEEINKISDSPRENIVEIFEKLLYGNQAIGQEVLGPKKNILSFTRQNQLDYFNKNFLANNAVLVIAGDFKDENPLVKIINYFEGFRSGQLPKNTIKLEEQLAAKLLIKNQKNDQAYCALGVRAYPLDHPYHYVAKIIAIILGGHMSSRLFKKLREDKGLVYNVDTFSENYMSVGYLVTYTSAVLGNMPEIVKIILEEYRQLGEHKLDEQEIEDARNYIIGKKKIVIESSDGAAFDLARRIILNKIAATPEDYYKLLKDVNADQVQVVARHIFQNNHLNLALVGSFAQGQKAKYKENLENFLKF